MAMPSNVWIAILDAIHQEGVAQGRLEGEERGRANGLTQGRLEGQIEGRRSILRRIIQTRLGTIPLNLERSIGTADNITLDLLITGAIQADDLPQVGTFSDTVPAPAHAPSMLDRIIHEAIACGTAEGEIRGHIEGQWIALQTIVQMRFGAVPSELTMDVADSTTLDALLRQALQSPTLGDFLTALENAR